MYGLSSDVWIGSSIYQSMYGWNPYIEELSIHRSSIHRSEYRCMDTPMSGWTNPFIGGWSINRSSVVWLKRYPLMGADVGVFQVADTLTYGYVYTLPIECQTFFWIIFSWNIDASIKDNVSAFQKNLFQAMLRLLFCPF